MPKQTITTEIDVPKGYEFLWIDKPEPGDVITNGDGKPIVAKVPGAYCRLIFRKKWQWPKWLKAQWIAKDASGCWFGYETEPSLDHDGAWINAGDLKLWLVEMLIDWNPPPCDNWRDSKRRNPNNMTRRRINE